MKWAYYQNQLKWHYRKNAFDLQGLLFRKYPDFILKSRIESLKNNLPVFVLHGVSFQSFEAQLAYLKKNNYTTLDADTLVKILNGEIPKPDRAVVLTFDDGWGSLWTTAFPLLQKYGMKAISFLLPGLIQEKGKSLNLFDVWNHKTSADSISDRDHSEIPLCTWEEIQAMHESGVIDFQSHGMYHPLIAVSSQVIDFMRPGFPAYPFANIFVPVQNTKKGDDYSRDVPLGTPIYASEPRYYKRPRYIEDINLSKLCVQFVEEQGGPEFFKNKNWQHRLNKHLEISQKRMKCSVHVETKDEQVQVMASLLRESKEIIENKLSNKTVRHFCYPWFLGSNAAVSALKKSGYTSGFWGFLPGNRENSPGSDPMKISRIEDRYIFRLPGEDRLSIRQIMMSHLKHQL